MSQAPRARTAPKRPIAPAGQLGGVPWPLRASRLQVEAPPPVNVQVSWGQQEQSPTWADYAAALRDGAPELFDPQASGIERVVTEFGAAIHCRHAFFASLVELTKPADGDTRIAIIHAGLDSWLRVP